MDQSKRRLEVRHEDFNKRPPEERGTREEMSGADPGIFKGGGPTLSKKFHPKFIFLSPQLEKGEKT
jgi:hypothetical protein